MKFSLKTLLIAFSMLVVILPAAIYFARACMQPEVCVSRLFQREGGSFQHYRNGAPTAESLPYINCICVHDATWGRPRIIVMHRVTQSRFRKNGQFPKWLDDTYPVRVSDTPVWATDDVIVVHATDGDKPARNLLGISEVPLVEPWWPDTSKLWEIVNRPNMPDAA